jgi:integrase
MAGSIAKRPDGKWRARYRDRAGAEHSKHFTRKIDAQRWLDEVTSSLVMGTYVAPAAGRETVRDYGERWRARQLHRERTGAVVEGILRLHVYPELGALPLASVDPGDIQALVKSWAVSSSPATVETRFRILAAVFRAAVRDRRLPRSPCDGVRLPSKSAKGALTPISTETVLALREAMPVHLQAFVTVAAGTGMRRGELCGLTVDRVDFLRKEIRVDRQLAPGTGDRVRWAETKTAASVRVIPADEVVIKAIAAHLAASPTDESGLVFRSAIGTPLRPSTLWMAWSRAAKQVGTDATPHDLRHYFASVLIRAGLSIKAIQRLLGHKSAVETLDTYGHLMGDEDDRSRAAIRAELARPADYLRTKGVPDQQNRWSEA